MGNGGHRHPVVAATRQLRLHSVPPSPQLVLHHNGADYAPMKH